jgi:hypothetical protein
LGDVSKDTIGGVDKKGHIYGLEPEAGKYKPSSSRSTDDISPSEYKHMRIAITGGFTFAPGAVPKIHGVFITRSFTSTSISTSSFELGSTFVFTLSCYFENLIITFSFQYNIILLFSNNFNIF